MGRENQMKVSSQAWLATLVTLKLKDIRKRGNFPGRKPCIPLPFVGQVSSLVEVTVCMQ